MGLAARPGRRRPGRRRLHAGCARNRRARGLGMRSREGAAEAANTGVLGVREPSTGGRSHPHEFEETHLTLLAKVRRPVWPWSRAGPGLLVESFPAGQLRLWKLPYKGYDGADGRETRAMNELTFAGWLAEFTATRADRRSTAGQSVLIASAAIEERQVDTEGRVRLCDLRFNSRAGRKLASGELKRPEVAHGRDPRNEHLRDDARRKALARGLPYYFTCNMSQVILYEVAATPLDEDHEVGAFQLAPLTKSAHASSYRTQIHDRWVEFLDALEGKLLVVAGHTRPAVTSSDIIEIRDAIYAVASEALPRVLRRVHSDPVLVEDLRQESLHSFDFPAALEIRHPARMQDELLQMLRFGIFVVTQKQFCTGYLKILARAEPSRFISTA